MLVQQNPFSVFAVGLDLIVVPICVYAIIREDVDRSAPHPA